MNVNSLTKKNVTIKQGSVTAADLNQRYALISADPQYLAPPHTVGTAENVFSEYHIFQQVDHLHHTAEGLDKLPDCFLRLAAPKYAITLAHLINQSSTSNKLHHTSFSRPTSMENSNNTSRRQGSNPGRSL